MATVTPRTQEERKAVVDRLADGFRKRRRFYDDAAEFPVANFAELTQEGFHALTIPDDFGGDGLMWGDRFADFYELLEMIARADSATGQLLQVHCHVLALVSRWGTPPQLETTIRDIVENRRMVASVGSEANPRTGTAANFTDELREGPTGWRLTCRKFFASGAPGADILFVWAAVPGAAPYAERMVIVAVPREAPEVELVNEWDTMGMRATASWGVKITDFDVPEDAIFGEPGEWARDPRTFILGYAANHVGTAQGALDFALDFVRERAHLSASESVRVTLGRLAAKVYGARAALMAAARVWERGDFPNAQLESLQAHHLCRAAGLEVTMGAFDICGARAAFRHFPLDVMLRDTRTFTLHDRDEVFMQQVGRGLVEGVLAGKGQSDHVPGA